MSTKPTLEQIEADPVKCLLNELRAWREIGPQMDAVLARVLAAQGDAAEPELVALQHALAALLGSPANGEPANGEQANGEQANGTNSSTPQMKTKTKPVSALIVGDLILRGGHFRQVAAINSIPKSPLREIVLAASDTSTGPSTLRLVSAANVEVSA